MYLSTFPMTQMRFSPTNAGSKKHSRLIHTHTCLHGPTVTETTSVTDDNDDMGQVFSFVLCC